MVGGRCQAICTQPIRQFLTLLTRGAVDEPRLALPAAAQNGEAPDFEFLEYLGSWQEEDETWFVDVEIENQDTDSDDEDSKRAQNEKG